MKSLTTIPQAKRDWSAELMFDAIRDGMWPFRMGEMTLFVDFDIDFNRYRLIAEAFFLHMNKTDRLCAVVPFSRDDVAAYPEETALEVAAELTRALRFRPIEGLLSPLIYLGEN